MEQDENDINAPMREDEVKESDRRPKRTTQSSRSVLPDRRMRVMDVVNYSGLGSWGLPKEGLETDNANAFHNFAGKIQEKLLANTLPSVHIPFSFIWSQKGEFAHIWSSLSFFGYSSQRRKKQNTAKITCPNRWRLVLG
jgi:hypothetical protein